jgi:hypothetical protein
MEYRLHTYNRTNGIIKRNFGKQMFIQTELRTHNSENGSQIQKRDMDAE